MSRFFRDAFEVGDDGEEVLDEVLEHLGADSAARFHDGAGDLSELGLVAGLDLGILASFHKCLIL